MIYSVLNPVGMDQWWVLWCCLLHSLSLFVLQLFPPSLSSSKVFRDWKEDEEVKCKMDGQWQEYGQYDRAKECPPQENIGVVVIFDISCPLSAPFPLPFLPPLAVYASLCRILYDPHTRWPLQARQNFLRKNFMANFQQWTRRFCWILSLYITFITYIY